ncbi:MAG: formate dehydrogenase subunit gamma [Pseudomonadota bacterium]|jgi:formate dehydrogenase subunit gamma
MSAHAGATAEQLASLQALVAAQAGREAPLLEILHTVNDAYGHVPGWCVAPLADALNLSRADVHGVISFYAWFRREPGARHVLRLCHGEACLAMGAAALAASLPATAECDVEPVYCLGNCACAPSAMLDREVLGRLDGATLRARLEQLP